MGFKKRMLAVGAAIALAGLIMALWAYRGPLSGTPSGETPSSSGVRTAEGRGGPSGAIPAGEASVELSPDQFETFKIRPVEERLFTISHEAVGSIDFNEEMSVQVFPPVQGKILSLFARAGDDVKAGMPLYTIDSPDLLQAGSNLIASAGVLELTTRVLKRAEELYAIQAIAQKELDQAVSDHQAAEGAERAARNAVRILGKTDAEIDNIIAQRKVDSVVVVRSPLSGRVVARNAAPGLLVQPGSLPGPYTLADISTLWMLADVAEMDFPSLRLGEDVEIRVKAYPGRLFRGKIVNIGASVDPTTHRVVVRSEVQDLHHELRPGMFATFLIRTGQSMRSPAVPDTGIVREGDGTMAVWVSTDRRRLVKRTVVLGLSQEGFYQIVAGLKAGELVATEGALFLSNALTEASR